MITLQDLQAAIAECQGQRNPDARTCIKLAAYLTIKEHLYGEEKEPIPMYSFANKGIDYDGDTEFAQAIYGKDENEVFAVMDELMSAVQVINPRLYMSVLHKLK